MLITVSHSFGQKVWNVVEDNTLNNFVGGARLKNRFTSWSIEWCSETEWNIFQSFPHFHHFPRMYGKMIKRGKNWKMESEKLPAWKCCENVKRKIILMGDAIYCGDARARNFLQSPSLSCSIRISKDFSISRETMWFFSDVGYIMHCTVYKCNSVYIM